MALTYTNRAAVSTLGDAKSQIRSQASVLDEQDSAVYEPQLDDIVNNSCTLIRQLMGRLLDTVYSETHSESENAYHEVDISGYSIYDLNRMVLYDSLCGKIPVLSNENYYAIKELYKYSTTKLASTALAYVTNQSDAGGLVFRQVIVIDRGSNLSPGNLKLHFYGNPRKLDSDDDHLDIPEGLVPLAVDISTLTVFQKVKKAPPQDAEARVVAWMNALGSAVGLAVSPVMKG